MASARAFVLRNPAPSVFVIALAVRLTLVVGSGFLYEGPLIPDEGAQIELATLASEGRVDDFCCGGYGRALYESTRLFVWQLHGLTAVFGPIRWILRMPAVLFAATAAFVVARIADQFVSKRWALGAGLVMAVTPSVVLHSSVVLRESLIWLLVVAAAGLVLSWADSGSVFRLVWAAVGLLAVLVGLGWLRDQTAVVLAWSLVPSALVVSHRRTLRVGLVLVLLVAGPWLSGSGPAGVHLVNTAASQLGSVRAWMSLDANSAFVSFDVLPSVAEPVLPSVAEPVLPSVAEPVLPSVAEPVLPSVAEPVPSGANSGAVGIAGRVTEEVSVGDRTFGLVAGSLLVDNSYSSSLKAVPGGLVAFYLRPFLWEGLAGSSLSLLAASVENLAWFAGYGLALYGFRPLWRSNPPLLVFGISYFVSIGLVASVTQGNLGTAFRHRAQVLWLVALLAAIGGQEIWHRLQTWRKAGEGKHAVLEG
jgi:hypothetical protein